MLPDLRALFKATYGERGWQRRVALAQGVTTRAVSHWVNGTRPMPAWRLQRLLERLERGADPIEQARAARYAAADRLAEQLKRDREGALMRVRLIVRGLADLPGTRIVHRAEGGRIRAPKRAVDQA